MNIRFRNTRNNHPGASSRLGGLSRLGAMPRVLPSAASVFILAALLLMVLAPGGSALAAPAVSSVPSQTLCAQTLWLLSELQSEMESGGASKHFWPDRTPAYRITSAEIAALTNPAFSSSTQLDFSPSYLEYSVADETTFIAPHIFARQTPIVAQIEYSLSPHESAFLCGARPHQFLE